MQLLTFHAREPLESIVQTNPTKKTTLTQWLHYNASFGAGHHLTYLDFPLEFVWYDGNKCWKQRANLKNPCIKRLTYIHLAFGEAFFLRMLLCHQKGRKSFADIRTVNNIVHSTYRSACEAIGLLGDDKEWSTALEEASVSASSSELRSLFANILMYCLVELLLNQCSRSIAEYGLPSLPPDLLLDLANRLIMEKKNYDRESLEMERVKLESIMNSKQKIVYDLITRASCAKSTELIFVYGHGGTGKTFLWKAIITVLRARGKIVLVVASSGIASLLLPSGRTALSRFKLPLVLTDESMCNVKKNTQMAKLLQKTNLILWDEAPTNNRRCFEALDRSLRDILDNNDVVFGGMSVILGRDFKQTLPIKKKGSKEDILDASITSSYLWQEFKLFTLTENMQLQRPGLTLLEKKEISDFSDWLLSIENGQVGSPNEQDPENARWVQIPDEYCIPDNEDGLANLISFIYPRESLQNSTTVELQQKAIVCPKNDAADAINKTIVDMVDGPIKTYHSLDTATPHGNDGGE
ncbi:uncharacterized protein [Rutidosis leptorrhynchoides]|uniref:uncharacterized protein n=1 Tax=Rutidosis leptorrhynchoides TaxID=125765 RepID=UPI003A99EBF5